MTALLWIVGWALIGACLMAFIYGKLDFEPEGPEWVGAILGTCAWPLVLMAVIVLIPAKWVFHKSKPKTKP